jgi:tRNA (mo5U34)-methyltransferase
LNERLPGDAALRRGLASEEDQRDQNGELRAEIDRLPWFHQIDFGNGILTPGSIRASKIRRVSRMLFDGMDLVGRTLLDVGCWDGAYSIEAARRGAAVTATDHYVWQEVPARRQAFELAIRRLAPTVRALDIPVEELTIERVGSFDIVLFLGVLYHLRDPLDALERVARLAVDTMIVETRMTMRHVGKPVMQFHPGRTLENDPTNWWTPNRPCVEAMLRDIGFREIRFTQPDWRWRRGLFHACR